MLNRVQAGRFYRAKFNKRNAKMSLYRLRSPSYANRINKSQEMHICLLHKQKLL